MNLPCKVCELLDNDTTPKQVTYCVTCKEYLCGPCEKNWIRRGLAMIKQKAMKILPIIALLMLASCQPNKSEETKRLEKELDSIRYEKGKTIDTLINLQNKQING